jgi:hypothetical protein
MAVLLTPPIATLAQSAKVGFVETVQGVGTVARAAAESQPLAANDDVFVQDRIMTGEGSSVRIRFTTDAMTNIGERAVMTISDENGNAVLHLERGAPLRGVRPGEALAIVTPNATARAAGGISVVTRESDAIHETMVCALEGSAFAAALGGVEIEVLERHCVWVSGSALGPVFPLSKPGTGMVSG